MKRQLKNVRGMRGFSLVELMVVVSIIGVLAALAMPKFKRFQARAKQSEAKTMLSQIYTLQIAYFGDNNAYANTKALLGFDPGSTAKYTYSDPTVSGATFTATASYAALCTAGDEWTITDTKTLAVSATKDCAKFD